MGHDAKENGRWLDGVKIVHLFMAALVGGGAGWGGSYFQKINQEQSVYSPTNLEQRVTNLETSLNALRTDTRRLEQKVDRMICLQIIEQEAGNWRECMTGQIE